MDFKQLRQQYPKFIYKSFSVLHTGENLTVKFDFEISPDIQFHPEVIFSNVSKARLDAIGEEQLNNLIFNLGMVEVLSYWKSTCSPTIIIEAGVLDEEQLTFWNNLLLQGLGEFFYQNKINFTQENFVTIEIGRKAQSYARFEQELKNRDLILVGGGKDSAVTLDILSGSKSNVLLLNPTPAALEITKIAGATDPIIVKRNLDSRLLELNLEGFLNGHTPFSAYLAFMATLVAVLYDFKNIIVSNESSSNEGNVEYLGMEVNHQYSKTFEFETLFRAYSQKYLSIYSDYFSFLRPLNELEISRIFAAIPQYHQAFRSCNVGSKTGIWCGSCPKCVSTYLTLFPFLGEKTSEIFGKDLFTDEKLIPIIMGLMRMNDAVKPFECVCSVDEIKYSIFLSIQKYQGKPLPVVLEAVKEYAKDLPELLNVWNDENYLPEHYIELLRTKL